MVRNTFLPLAGIPNPQAKHKAASGVWLSLTVILTCLVSAPAQAQIVDKVIDGDSLQVRGVGEVRLIGVDTPEWDAPFGKEARAFTQRLVEGKHVRLQYDRQKTDKYGRTLAYVHLPDGGFVNELLIQHGYGRLIKRFPFRYRDRFQRYEREAQRAGLGLWGLGRRPQKTPPPGVLGRYDDNGDGRITCAEARRHGITPVHRDHPAYPYMHDADNDGIVCEWDVGAGKRHPSRTRPTGVLERYDDNGNGRITCAEARRHGITPVHRGHPAYPYMYDADNDGIVCEWDVGAGKRHPSRTRPNGVLGR